MFKLQNLRRHRHLSIMAYIGFGVIIISFIFFYGWSSNQGKDGGPQQVFAEMKNPQGGLSSLLDGTVTIDSARMSQAQNRAVEEKLAPLDQQFKQFFRSQGQAERLVTPNDVAVAAANNVIMNDAAEKMGVKVTQKMVIDDLAKNPSVSDEMIEQQARSMGLPNKFALIELERQSRQNTMVENLKQLTAHASLFEMWQEYNIANEKMTMKMAAYPADQYLNQAEVTDKELEDYLAQHRETFRVPDQRRYAYIKLAKDELKVKIQPTDQELQVYYDNNQDKFKQPAAVRNDEIVVPKGKDDNTTAAVNALNAAREEAAASKDWMALSKSLKAKYPELSFFSSKTNWISSDDQSKSEEYVARSLTLADDTVSTPVADNRGVYLIRVAERRAEGVPPLADVKDKVLETYKDAKATEQFDAEVERLKKEVKNFDSLRTFAQAMNYKDELTTRVARTETKIPGLGDLTEDMNYIRALQINEISDMIVMPQSNPTMLAVMQVIEETEAYDPKLEEVREQVEKAVKTEKAVTLAKNAAIEALARVNGGAEFDKVAQAAPKPLFTTQPITRMKPDTGLEGPLVNFAKETMKIDDGSTSVTAYGYNAERPTGYALWKVERIEPASIKNFRQEREQFEQEYMDVQKMTVVREWLATQRKKNDFQMVKEKQK